MAAFKMRTVQAVAEDRGNMAAVGIQTIGAQTRDAVEGMKKAAAQYKRSTAADVFMNRKPRVQVQVWDSTVRQGAADVSPGGLQVAKYVNSAGSVGGEHVGVENRACR